MVAWIKRVEFELAANGILGLQTTVPLLLSLVHTGVLSLNRMVEALTLAPARLLNLPGGLGTIKPGAFADLVVMDLNQEWDLNPG